MAVDYTKQYDPDQLEPFFPNEIVKMSIVVLCTLALIMFLVVLPILLSSAGLVGIFHEEQPADPRTTPQHIRPEWYFLAVYQYLKLMPQEMLGIDGKALGIFTQGIGVALLLLLPFWYPLQPAGLNAEAWRRGLLTFCLMGALFVLPAGILGWVRSTLPGAYRDLLHPMFVWPPLAFAAFVVAGWTAKRAGLADAFKWLKLFTIGILLIGFQFLAFIAVLGQGLSWVLPVTLGYLIGAVLFLAAACIIVRFIALRICGRDEKLREVVLVGIITEGILLFVGLTIWAMWPAGGLITEHGWHREAKSFGFFVLMIGAALVVFFALIAAERRTIRRTLRKAKEKREIS